MQMPEQTIDGGPQCVDAVAELQARALAGSVPLAGSIALTHRCNLRCVHCYARGASPPAAELPTSRILDIIDQAADAGCLFLLLTGGEPLLRPDFAQIYTHAKERGILVSVFTNGTLIGDETLRLFRALPPRVVDISLYGMTAATCRAVTQVDGVLDKCLCAARRLKEQGTTVTLKTVILTLNQHEFRDMEHCASAAGLRFRLDAAVFPRFNGDRTPLEFRIPAAQAAALEMSDHARAQRWRVFFERQRRAPGSDRLYQCGAGRTSFHVDPRGRLQPCVMATHIAYPIAAGGFVGSWRAMSKALRERRAAPDSHCSACEKRALCGYCPPFARLESGDESARSEYLCALGNARLDRMMDMAECAR